MIAGRYLDGLSAQGVDATLAFDADGWVRVHTGAATLPAQARALRVSDRVGNIPRRLVFPDGGVFETRDNDAVDAALDALGLNRSSALVSWLERRWPVAIGSLVLVALVSVAFLRWGVPAVASWGARVMPAKVDRAIGSGTLEVLDRVAFEPTGLSPTRQQQLRRRFAEVASGQRDDGHEYRLEFRGGGGIGANAFALPSGIVVMTDELVAMADHDDELVAVLAHEVGHVRGRHALRQLLQAAGVSALAMALLGDVSSISGILSAAPALLHAKHSRDFEREADAFAKQWLHTHGIPESRFDDILCRISHVDDDPRSAQLPDFTASHPPTRERAHCTPPAAAPPN